MERWGEYFTTLMEDEIQEDNIEEKKMENISERLRPFRYIKEGKVEDSKKIKESSIGSGLGRNNENEEIMKEERGRALKKMKLRKAPGHDGLVPEMIKYMGQNGKAVLGKLFNKVMKEKENP